MNYQTLFTAEGFKTFLSEYHKLLNAKLGFPALTGMKPLHRAADVFSLPGGEALLAVLGKMPSISQKPLMLFPAPSVAELYSQWLPLDSAKMHDDAAETAHKFQLRNMDCLVPSMLLAESLRAQGEKTAAAALYAHIVQRTESMQDVDFSWSTACLSRDTDEAWSLELAMIALAGLAIENGRHAMSAMYFQRVRSLSLSVAEQSDRQRWLSAWVAEQEALLSKERETPTFDGRMALGQQWGRDVQWMVRAQKGGTSPAPTPKVPSREPAATFELTLSDLADLHPALQSVPPGRHVTGSERWRKFAQPFVDGLEKAIRDLERQGILVASPDVYKKYCQLDEFATLCQSESLSFAIRNELREILRTIRYRFPSDADPSPSQSSSTKDLFQYMSIEHPCMRSA